MSSYSNLIIVGLAFVLLIVAAQAYLAARSHIAYGLIIPAAFLLLAGYNLYKSLYVYNPYPTMAEGMFMTLGLAGFAVSAVALVLFRIKMRRSNQ